MTAEMTLNLGLVKPTQEDFYNVQDFNDNMDILDEVVAQHEKKIEGAAYILGDDGKKYRWGVDEIGVYLESVEEGENV